MGVFRVSGVFLEYAGDASLYSRNRLSPIRLVLWCYAMQALVDVNAENA